MTFEPVIEAIRSYLPTFDLLRARRLYNTVRLLVGSEIPYYNAVEGTVSSGELTVDGLNRVYKIVSGDYELVYEDAVHFSMYKEAGQETTKSYTVVDGVIQFSDDMEGSDVVVLCTRYPAGLVLTESTTDDLIVPSYYAEAIAMRILADYFWDDSKTRNFYLDLYERFKKITKDRNTPPKGWDVRNL